MFSTLHADAAALFCGFKGDPSQPPQYAWAAMPWRPGEPLPWKIRPDHNNYVAISSFCRDGEGKTRRRKVQYKRLHAVMIDDVGTKVTLDRVCLEPSVRTESSPRNYQDLLFVVPDADSDNVEIATQLIDQLVANGLNTGGIDPGMKGVTRVARLPQGVNGKGKYVEKLGHPFRCRCVLWEPERRYTVREIAEAYKLDLTLPERRAAMPPSAAVISIYAGAFRGLLEVLCDAGLYQRARRDGWHDIVCPWVHEHTDRGTTGSAIHDPSAENNWLGGFQCFHGHCAERDIQDMYLFAAEYRRRALSA